jgi:hypothetical protein
MCFTNNFSKCRLNKLQVSTHIIYTIACIEWFVIYKVKTLYLKTCCPLNKQFMINK